MNPKIRPDFNDVSNICIRIQDFYMNDKSDGSFEEQDELRKIVEHWLTENNINFQKEN